jgi:hypothetical protein
MIDPGKPDLKNYRRKINPPSGVFSIVQVYQKCLPPPADPENFVMKAPSGSGNKDLTPDSCILTPVS